MSKGLVYILTNPCLDGWVKIGMTERNNIDKRLHELNSPENIPLSYQCYATYEVDNPRDVEKRIHSIIDRIDDSLHAREHLDNGRIREREFFKITPETAYGIFKDVAALRGDSDKLIPTRPTTNQSQESEIAETRSRKSNNSFELLDITIGEEVSFLFDDSIVAVVQDKKNHVLYHNQVFTVTGLAKMILIEKYGWSEDLHVNGWRYFTKNGMTLSDLRNLFENEEELE